MAIGSEGGGTRATFLALVALCAMSVAVPARGQTPQPANAQGGGGSGAADLAKKLSNPVSDLVSVPFQFNWAQPVGPDEATRFILNVQPVMPFSVNEDWNLIARVILPFVGQPSLVPDGTAASGLSDVLASFFFSPKSGKLIWGVGPVLSLPSNSEPTLGTGKWSAGPTVVLLKQSGPWTYGALWNQVWSFAGPSSRLDVNQMYLQPFLVYNTPTAVSIGMNSETIANWKAESGQKWTVPLNFFVSKVATFGMFPASYQVGVGFYVDKPEGGPDWQLRSTITLLLPKR
jgi:hypothetical protein